MHTEWGHDAVGPVVVAFVVSFNPSVQQSELFAAVCPSPRARVRNEGPRQDKLLRFQQAPWKPKSKCRKCW